MNDSDRLVEIIHTRRFDPTNAHKTLEEIPTAYDSIVDWLKEAKNAGDHTRFHALVNFAALLTPPGMPDVLIPIVESQEKGYLLEDIVEILGELESSEAVAAISTLLKKKSHGDEIDQSLCIKCIHALANIDTSEARSTLKDMTHENYPDILRWYAAFELEIEEELGFNEDEMTGPVHNRES